MEKAGVRLGREEEGRSGSQLSCQFSSFRWARVKRQGLLDWGQISAASEPGLCWPLGTEMECSIGSKQISAAKTERGNVANSVAL